MLVVLVLDLESLNIIKDLQTMSYDIAFVSAPIEVIGLELLPINRRDIHFLFLYYTLD